MTNSIKFKKVEFTKEEDVKFVKWLRENEVLADLEEYLRLADVVQTLEDNTDLNDDMFSLFMDFQRSAKEYFGGRLIVLTHNNEVYDDPNGDKEYEFDDVYEVYLSSEPVNLDELSLWYTKSVETNEIVGM